MHTATRDCRLTQLLALKSGQVLGWVIGPHTKHNKRGRGTGGRGTGERSETFSKPRVQ